MADFDIVAEPRTALGKAEMRRMRHSGQVPAIVYGAGKEPLPITLVENVLRKQMEQEGFFSHILTLKVEGRADEQTVVKALQRHPANSQVMHLDLMRVSALQKLTLTVALHFEGEQVAPGARVGGAISHHVTEVEVSCLPANLPEFVAVDVSGVELGGSIHLSDIALPDGVELTALTHDNDLAVLSIAMPRTSDGTDEAEDGIADSDAPEVDASDEDSDE